MPSNSKLLRGIPKVDELLAHPVIAGHTREYSHAAATEATRQILDELRGNILSGVCLNLPGKDALAGLISAKIRQNATPGLRRVINATGVILHTNLGRAPLAGSAAKAAKAAAEGYCTLEYNVEDGARGSRHSHVAGLLTGLTGAEDALCVNNNAAAVLLMLSALAGGKEVVVSRGELVEIGGAFRIPDVMEQSGCILKEVGTTNRTRPADYEYAIDPQRTGALLKAHASNYKIIGFTEEVSLAQMSELGGKYGLPVLYDLGSGSLIPLAAFGVHGEPCVTECIRAGADVVCFSGDKLLGGPQAGILLGRRELIAKMKRHPLARALRMDKLTLAALEATLRLYKDPEKAVKEIPVLRMLAATQSGLREKAERLAALLEPVRGQISVADEESRAGGGSLPGQTLPSVAVEVKPAAISAAELERRLREWETPIVARIARDRLLLDVRTIEESDFPCVAECIILTN